MITEQMSKVSLHLFTPLIQCWHCDAPNMADCQKVGMYKTCPHNAQSCMIETRKRNGIMEQVRLFLFKSICKIYKF